MPNRPPIHCPRCQGVHPAGVCPQARAQAKAKAQQRSKARGPRPYNRVAWQRLRRMILARDPICRDPEGCTQPSTDVDHRNGDATDNREDNLWGLCHAHHSKKTAREQGGYGNTQRG